MYGYGLSRHGANGLMWQNDPLSVCQTTDRCPECQGERKRRKHCQTYRGAGFPPVRIAGLWAPRPAFLVCGGPSMRDLPIERLRDRGVLSLAINGAGAYAPVTAHTFGDPQTKFHSAMFLDPKVLSFVPFGKLWYAIQVKHGGRFYPTNIRCCDCPSTYGFSRTSVFDADEFLTTPHAHWGNGHAEAAQRNTFRRLCTPLLGLRLLHYLGVSRVYLLGVDHEVAPRESETPGYAWGDNASCGNRIWWKIDSYYERIKPVMEAAGCPIYNCNPASKCEVFDFVTFADALDDCKGPVEDEPLDCHDWYNKKLAEQQHAEFGKVLTEADVARLRLEERSHGLIEAVYG